MSLVDRLGTATLRAIAPQARVAIIGPVGAALPRVLPRYDIVTALRIVHFIAQAAHESDNFRTLSEYGGAAYFARYDGRKDLGNVVAGDGKRFKGRGIFQCTGRDNYARYGKRLGLDLIKEPALAARPDISVRIAVLYWGDKGLNPYADRGDTAAISRAINRGDPKAKKAANHESNRIKIAKKARELLGA